MPRTTDHMKGKTMTYATIYKNNGYTMTCITPGHDGRPKFTLTEYPEDLLARCVIDNSGAAGITLQHVDGCMTPDEAQALAEDMEAAQEQAAELQWCADAAKEIIAAGAERITSYRIDIKLGNDAMQEPEHAAGALRALANQIETGATFRKVYDKNGNDVGTMTATTEPRLQADLDALADLDW